MSRHNLRGLIAPRMFQVLSHASCIIKLCQYRFQELEQEANDDDVDGEDESHVQYEY